MLIFLSITYIHPPTPPSQVIYNMATNMLPVFIVSYAVFFFFFSLVPKLLFFRSSFIAPSRIL